MRIVVAIVGAVIVVAAGNDAPVAIEDTLDTSEDNSARFNLAELLSNDHDPDADDVANLIEFAQASNGTVGYDALTGILTYTPDTNFAGTDHFTYKIGRASCRERVLRLV